MNQPLNPPRLPKAPTPPGRYAPVNGLEIYYELHGRGRPLVLLHGGLTTIASSFGALLPRLAAFRRIVAIEQQAHGHTADADRPFSFEQMADDTAALLGQLGIEEADLFGYSDGGNVALGVALRHPGLARKLVLAGTHYRSDGLYPDILEGLRQAKADDIPAALREEYERVAPHPEHWPRLVAKQMKQHREFEGWRAEELRRLWTPTLILVGDNDIVRPEHAVELFRLLPYARLAVLPDTDHVALMLERPDCLAAMVNEFLDEPTPDEVSE